VNLKLKMELKEWRLKAPFITAAEMIDAIQVLQVTVSQGGVSGRSETMGVDYLNETVEGLQAELAALDPATIAELDGELLQNLLPPGGSRNGLDCALWDLLAKQSVGGISGLAGIAVEPVNTLFTLSLDEPEAMARQASAVPDLQRLKLKLNADAPL
jgi:L-alanine-DL-glutamate epimerase-like enolase superfamily enzyme